MTRWTTPLPPCPTTSMTCRSSSAMSKDAPPWPPLPSDVVAPSADAGRVASVASPSHSPPDSSSAPSSSSLDDVDRARAPISRDFPPRFVSSVGESSRTARLAPGGVDAPLSFAPVGVGAGAVGVPTPEMRRPFLSISKSPSRNAPDSVRSYGLASSVAVGSEMVTFLRLSGIDAMRTPPASSPRSSAPRASRSALRNISSAENAWRPLLDGHSPPEPPGCGHGGDERSKDATRVHAGR